MLDCDSDPLASSENFVFFFIFLIIRKKIITLQVWFCTFEERIEGIGKRVTVKERLVCEQLT